MQADTARQPLLEPPGPPDRSVDTTNSTRTEISDETPLLKTPQHGPGTDWIITDDKVPYKNIDGRRFWWLFAALLMAYLLAMFDSTVTSASHPVITSYFNASNAASWLSTVFYLTVTVSQPLYGRVSDAIGRRPVHLFAAAVFAITTTWCALAQSIGSLIAARAVCGAGAGGIMTMSSIILADVIKIEHRGIFQSYVNVAYGFGNGLGAALGGIICDKLGWRWIFGIQIPFICMFIVLTFFTLPSDTGPNLAAKQGKSSFESFKTFDFAGSATLVTALGCLILGINLGGSVLPWTHPAVITALAVFLISMITLIHVERKATLPVLPPSLLWGAPFGNLMWSNLFGLICTNFVIFNLPILVQAVWQASPTATGLYLLLASVGGLISSFTAGFFIQRTRKMKPTMTIGAFCFLAGLVSMTFLAQPEMPVWAVIILSPWTSPGQGFLFPSSTVAVLALCDSTEAAVVTTTQGLFRNLGGILGVAISSWILQNALTLFLQRMLVGSDTLKHQIIEDVRRSVEAIAKLDHPYKSQVIAAYAKALQVTFASGIIFAIMIVVLIVPLKLPRMTSSHEPTESEGTVETVDETAAERADGV